MAAGYLLDTNVVSETRKRRAQESVIAFLAAAPASQLFVSVLTIGELRKGVAAKRSTDLEGAGELARWVDAIEITFADRILPVEVAVARAWGELSASRTLPVIDTLIAATAAVYGLALVTRNVRDVGETGVELINPWAAE